ncbi:GOLPH3/VPS74 family protein [Planosporangium sp. 12N6]|uniref:GOLPH3/VPS74 family protein n=1 Tax=Planosporangium spinosum TaxID=3402278 RepID=UPI003CFAE4F6
MAGLHAKVLRLTGELYFITHDEYSGRPRSRAARAIGLGLAGARLAEVLFSGHLRLVDRRLIVTDASPPALADQYALCERMYHEPQLADVRTALRFFAHDAATVVGERLVGDGFAERMVRRRLGRPPITVYRATDPNDAAWQAVRLARLLTERQPMTWPDIVLAGLVQATGLLGHVLWHDRIDGEAHLDALLRTADPPLRDLVAEVAAAVADRLMAGRT